jgi:hypothetical protein
MPRADQTGMRDEFDKVVLRRPVAPRLHKQRI